MTSFTAFCIESIEQKKLQGGFKIWILHPSDENNILRMSVAYEYKIREH